MSYRRHRRNSLFGFGVLFLIFGVILFLSGNRIAKNVKQYEDYVPACFTMVNYTPIETYTTTETKRSSSSSKSTKTVYYHLRYQADFYYYAGDTKYDATGTFVDSSLSRDINPTYVIGEQYMFYYNPQNPSQYYLGDIHDEIKDANKVKRYGVLLCLAGLGLCIGQICLNKKTSF